MIQRGSYCWQNDRWQNFKAGDFTLFKARCQSLADLENAMPALHDAEDAKLMKANALLVELDNSSAIEGIRLDSSSLRSAIAAGLDLDSAGWGYRKQGAREMRNVKASIAFFKSGSALSINDILSAHAHISNKQDWGQFRNHSESVFDENGVPVYDAPPAGAIGPMLSKMLIWWNGARKEFAPPVASALAHLIFVTIHPFGDANGRIARMIADKALLGNGKEERVCSISSGINANRNEYYKLLNKAQISGDLLSYVDFMLDIHESALEIAGALRARLLAASAFIKNSETPFSRAERAIIHEMALGNHEYWTLLDATQYLEDSESASQAWNRLKDMGVIENGVLRLN